MTAIKTLAYGIDAPGGIEAIQEKEMTLDAPKKGEAIIRQTAIGLNFIDIYHRSGLYPLPLPAILGTEGAGIVEAVGEDCDDIKPGMRVAYASVVGGYAQYRKINADRLVPLPDDISDELAASTLLRGMTAEYLLRRTYQVQAGDWVLFYAAAGGVGMIALQWLKRLGANVIGVVSNEEKAALAKSYGADHVIIGRGADVAGQVKAITEGQMVNVVYDSIGKDTLMKSLDSLAPLGMMVSFGNASGAISSFDPAWLAARGSLFFTRPSLMAYTAKRDDLLMSANRYFAEIRSGITINITQKWALKDVAKAQAYLESGQSNGATLLMP